MTSRDAPTSPLGLIAGSGVFPLHFVRNARARGIEVVVVAHHGETDPEIERLASACTWIRVGQLGKLLNTFLRAGARQVAFAGGINRTRLFRELWPDAKALAVLARIGSVKDDAVLRAVAGELERNGIEVISATALLPEVTPGPALLTKKGLSPEEEEWARVGWHAAKVLGGLDIGQTVVVNAGIVVAVEAVEGTDEAIRRGAALSGPGVIVVKVSKPIQDQRIDLPTIGPRTVELLAELKGRAAVIEAGRSIVLEPLVTVREADRCGISILVREEREAR